VAELISPEMEGKVPEDLLDFRNFLFIAWKYLNLPEPTDLQYEMAEYVQYGPRRRMIKGYRGIGKSYITSAYVLWRLLLNPSLKVIVLSANKDRATAFTTFTKRLIEGMPILKGLIPEGSQRKSVVAFDVGGANDAHAASVRSIGIFGQMTGSRGDLIVLDDIEVPGNSDTQGARTKLRERAKEIEAVGSPGHEVVILCTDQSEDSVYRELHRFYPPRMWPARYPRLDKLSKYGDWLAPSIVQDLMDDPDLAGTPTDPLRYDEDELLEREAIYGPSGFALQFMLDPSLEDDFKHPLKVSDLIIHPVDKEHGPEGLVWTNREKSRMVELPNLAMDGDYFHESLETIGDYIPWTGTVMGIDPSGKGRDELSYTVSKMLNGYIHIPINCGLQGGYEEENLVAIAKTCAEWGVQLCIIEKNFGQGMFGELLKPVLAKYSPGTGITLKAATVAKEKRIADCLEPLMAQHRLVFDPSVVTSDYETGPHKGRQGAWDYRLIHQMTRLTREKGCLVHDDRLDSLEIAVSHWTEAAALDAEKRIQARRDALQRKDDIEFMNHQTDGRWRKPKTCRKEPKVLRSRSKRR